MIYQIVHGALELSQGITNGIGGFIKHGSIDLKIDGVSQRTPKRLVDERDWTEWKKKVLVLGEDAPEKLAELVLRMLSELPKNRPSLADIRK